MEWISLQTKFGNQRKELCPTGEPSIRFAICNGDEGEAVYAYCNLHGLWVTEADIALLLIPMRAAADAQPATVAVCPVPDRQGGQQITEMKTDDHTKRNKTAANGFTGSTDKDRPPNGGSDIP